LIARTKRFQLVSQWFEDCDLRLSNQQMLLAGANVLMELEVVRLAVLVVRMSGRLANGRVAPVCVL